MRRALFLLAVFLSEKALAATYPGIRDGGDPVAGFGAREVAMGSTGTADDFFRNPGAMQTPGRFLRFAAGLSSLSEMSAETTSTRFNDSARFEANALGLLWAGERAWAGLSAAPAWDFHYDDAFTLYDAAGLPTSQSQLKDNGTLWVLSPGAGVHRGAFSFGVAAEVLTGKETLSARRFVFGTGTVLDLREKAAYAGIGVRVGAALRVNEKARVGLTFRPPARLRRTFDLANAAAPERGARGVDRWLLPPSWSAGVAVRAPGDFPTTLAVEIEQTFWPRFRRNGKRVDGTEQTKPFFDELAAQSAAFDGSPAPRRFHDATELRLGVEHALNAEWDLRYGFRHAPAAFDPGVEGTFFTAGAGWRASPRWRLSVAGEWGKRDYAGDGIFLPAAHRRDETHRRLLLGGDYSW